MKNQSKKNNVRANIILIILAAGILITAVTETATANSLYVIADIGQSGVDRSTPVQAYHIEADGSLTFQAKYVIPRIRLGAVGITIDTDHGFLFITYEASDEIQLVDARTMTGEGTTMAPGATNLAGIVYDHDKSLLYCVNRGGNRVYAYNWNPENKTLTHKPGSPFALRGASAYGIALNEVEDLLYVANNTNEVTVYRTSDWRLVDTITLNRVAISVAVGVVRGFLYTGGGFVGNQYLTQYHLATGTVKEVQVEPDAGVMGLGVDPATGYVYLTTGVNDEPGGDNLLVFDTNLRQIGMIPKIGNPTGLVVPGREFSYDPLNFNKTLVRGGSGPMGSDGTPSVRVGATITYGIHFDNNNDFIVTDVVVSDQLPEEVTFITADDNTVNGHYDAETHTYEWLYPSLPLGTSTDLELTVEVDKGVETGTVITNNVTISSAQTAPTTKSFDVVAESHSLNLIKRISGVAEGQVGWVEADEFITYTICFDNRNSNLPVTNVTVVDYLPDEVKFIDLGKETPSGTYDAMEHTYTWTFSSLETGEAVCLNINVKVNKDVDPGTIITNFVTIKSDETGPSNASADVITRAARYNPLNLSKEIIGGDIEYSADSTFGHVSPGGTIIYDICFDNINNNYTVNNISIVDTLPNEVSFISADGDGIFGEYDPIAHTYRWSYSSLPPGSPGDCLNLVVQVNEGVAPDMTITNFVTIDSDETEPSNTNADVIIKAIRYNPLNLSKEITGGNIEYSADNDVGYVGVGDTIIYSICFDNINNDYTINNISIVDTLPEEVSFITADGDGMFGEYDPIAHTYRWSYYSLSPGSPGDCLKLMVQVNEGTAPDKTITNFVTIDSYETGPAIASVDVVTYKRPLEAALSILPNMLRRNGSYESILAIVELPQGIGKQDIKDEPLILKPGNIEASSQIVLGTADRAEVRAWFDTAQLMDAVPGYGEVRVTVVGKFKSGQSFSGEEIIYITRFTGN
jgi:uncharacterized repeat protein (TIGR01451 family)